MALGDQAVDAEKAAAEEREAFGRQDATLRKHIRGLERTIAKEAAAVEEKQEVSRRQRRLEQAQQAEVAMAVQGKLIEAADREAALRERVAVLESGAVPGTASVMKKERHASDGEAAAAVASDLQAALTARDLALARVDELEAGLRAVADAAEEKREASRRQRRLEQAQHAEVATAVQEKLVAAADRESVLRGRVAALEAVPPEWIVTGGDQHSEKAERISQLEAQLAAAGASSEGAVAEAAERIEQLEAQLAAAGASSELERRSAADDVSKGETAVAAQDEEVGQTEAAVQAEAAQHAHDRVRVLESAAAAAAAAAVAATGAAAKEAAVVAALAAEEQARKAPFPDQATHPSLCCRWERFLSHMRQPTPPFPAASYGNGRGSSRSGRGGGGADANVCR